MQSCAPEWLQIGRIAVQQSARGAFPGCRPARIAVGQQEASTVVAPEFQRAISTVPLSRACARAAVALRTPRLASPERPRPGSTPFSTKASRSKSGPWALYQQRMLEGTIKRDHRQEAAMELMQRLHEDLMIRWPKRKPNLTVVDSAAPAGEPAATGSPLNWFTSLMTASGSASTPHPERSARRGPRGLYLWGGVGVGKSMLMELFRDASPREFRVKFTNLHEFMQDTHARLAKCRGEQDPLKIVADQMSSHTRVLLLDEFFVTNVSDAMIIARLFKRLWDRGLTLVATSNRHPNKLYEGGLQRDSFIPFINQLEHECVVHDMDSATDYREIATKTVGVYFVRGVDGKPRDERLVEAVAQIVPGVKMRPEVIEVAMDRTLDVPMATGSICICTFSSLCDSARWAADYKALVSRFHTVAVQGVPKFTASNRNQGYRFVHLIDVLYTYRAKVLLSAEGYAKELFAQVFTQQEAAEQEAKGVALPADALVDDELGFQKNRTVSRLEEMQSIEYAVSHAERHAPELLNALHEAQRKHGAGMGAKELLRAAG